MKVLKREGSADTSTILTLSRTPPEQPPSLSRVCTSNEVGLRVPARSADWSCGREGLVEGWWVGGGVDEVAVLVLGSLLTGTVDKSFELVSPSSVELLVAGGVSGVRPVVERGLQAMLSIDSNNTKGMIFHTDVC